MRSTKNIISTKNMLFEERKIESGFSYRVEDLFGEVNITATRKLEPNELDNIVLIVLREKTESGTIEGVAEYKFKPSPTWVPEEKEQQQ